MALVNMRTLLKDAEEKDYAVPAYNITTWETFKAMMAAAEEERAPLIISLTPKFLRFLGPEFICPIVREAAGKSEIPFALHLDHGRTMEDVQLAAANGFTSVMIDGSMYPMEENIRLTREIKAFVDPLDISVEGELGAMVWDAKHQGEDTSHMTDPEAAGAYAKASGVDALAVSIGNNHGIYVTEPVIDFPRLAEIKAKTGIPLVLHGGTGTPGLPQVISGGVRKVNVNSAFQVAYRRTMEAEMNKPYQINDFSDVITTPVVAALKEVAVHYIREFRADHRY